MYIFLGSSEKHNSVCDVAFSWINNTISSNVTMLTLPGMSKWYKIAHICYLGSTKPTHTVSNYLTSIAVSQFQVDPTGIIKSHETQEYIISIQLHIQSTMLHCSEYNMHYIYYILYIKETLSLRNINWLFQTRTSYIFCKL